MVWLFFIGSHYVISVRTNDVGVCSIADGLTHSLNVAA
jgi:hypothetical protein